MGCVPEGLLHNQEETDMGGVCPKLLLLNECTGITFLSLLFNDIVSIEII
jgi:hypothetical protein